MIGRLAVYKRQAATVLGILFTLIAFGTSWVIFSNSPKFISIGTILMTIIISMPLVSRLLKQEAKRASDCDHFWHAHEPIIDFLLYFFIGVFLASFLLSLLFPQRIFSAQDFFGIERTMQVSSEGLYSIVKGGIIIMIISFTLSVFHGSGALLLVVLNASMLASSVADAARHVIPQQFGFWGNYAFIACNMSIVFFHGIPELASYIFAAVAGSLLAKAFEPNNQFSEQFYKLLKDAGMIAIYAAIALAAGAVIQTTISRSLENSNICITEPLTVPSIAIVLIIAMVAIEIGRKNK